MPSQRDWRSWHAPATTIDDLPTSRPAKVWVAWGIKYGDEADDPVVLGVFGVRDRAEAECERREAEFDDDQITEHEVKW